MYSTPGGPQGSPMAALIAQQARQFSGIGTAPRVGSPQPGPEVPFYPGGGGPQSTTIPAQLTPYGQYHESGSMDELGPNANAWGRDPIEHNVSAIPGATPAGLHPMILAALNHVRSMGMGETPGHAPTSLGIGIHPQVDRFHQIQASHHLATLMAQLSQRSLLRNQYGGRH